MIVLMTLYNTSQYPTKEIVRLITEYAVGLKDTEGVHINVKNSSRTFAGRAYPGIPSISNAPRGSKYLVVIRLGGPSRFPWTRTVPYKAKCNPTYTLHDWKEALVEIAAHELQHCEQFRHNRKRSEIETETAGVRALGRYRAAKNADRQKMVLDIQRRIGVI